MSGLIGLTRLKGLKRRAVLASAVAAAACLMLIPITAPAEQKAPIPDKAAVCAGCHPEAAQTWANSLHRRTVGAPQIPEAKQGCEACHYGTQDHIADVTDPAKRPSLKKLTADQIAAVCQSCHRGGEQALWDLSAHSRDKDACLTCHDPHRGEGEHMLKTKEPQLCQECHPTQVAEGNLPFHHPIKEGKMVCSDCHNVHGDQRGNLPEASNGEMCFRCHPQNAGPFAAEHPPVTEDCTICHRPHGSPVQFMLVQDQPMLCLQCHPGHSDGHRTPIVGTTPNSANTAQTIYAFYARCTSCHSRIHGTDLLSGSGNPTFMPGSPATPLGSHVASQGFTTAAVDQNLWGFADFGVSGFGESGNQTYVRQYDGRDYQVPSAEISVTKFGKSDDFRFMTTDLPRGDQEIRLRMGNPRYDIQIRDSGLTHRLGRFDDTTNVPIPAQNGGTNEVRNFDLTNGQSDFHIDRSLVDVRLAARCPKLPNAKWMLNYWQDSRTGQKQFLFLDRCIGCHKYQTAEPIDRITTITQEGVQVDFPKASLRYLRGQEEFSNRAPEQEFNFKGRSSVFNGAAPLFGVASTRATTNDLRGSAALGKRTSVAGLWRTRDRRNLLSDGKMDVRSLGGGVSYALSSDLRLQASHFQRDLDLSAFTEEGVSRSRDTTRADLRYSGMPNAVWSLGFAKEQVKRETEREVPLKTDSDIWTAAVTAQPASRLTLQLRYRGTNTDQRDFELMENLDTSSRLVGLPTRGRLLNGVLSYELNRNTLLSALYTRKHDTYDVEAPSGLRKSEEKIRTEGAQVVHSEKRSRTTAGYYRQTGDTGANVIYGTDTFTLAPPLAATPTEFPPIHTTDAFHYRATIEMVDSSVWATSRLRIFGRYARTKTDGREMLFNLGDYIDNNPDLNGVALVLNPFDVEIRDRWLGAGYMLTPDTEVVLSHQRASWADAANRTHDGSYSTWRVGFKTRF
jgi:DmsE family decaheme c-type cytochrome